jgi:hypothetical protein
MIDKLPDEINTHIISYLICKNPKDSLHLESYKNLTSVNKEFYRNLIKYSSYYQNLKSDIQHSKFLHKKQLLVVQYELQLNTEKIAPVAYNDMCLLCGKFAPISKEKLICGQCDKSTVLCNFCISRFDYKMSKFTTVLFNKNESQCVGCINFKKCKWCDKNIHPLLYLDKFDSMSYFCGLKCRENEYDFLFFASSNMY